MRIISWNIDGLNSALTGTSNRAKLSQATLANIAILSPDIIGIQETKLSSVQVKHIRALNEYFPDYALTTNFSKDHKGYAGTMILYRQKKGYTYKLLPDFDTLREGRITAIEVTNDVTLESTVYMSVYVPNSGDKLHRLPERQEWDKKFLTMINDFVANGKNVVYFGDLNVAHEEIDLKNPKTNHLRPGFSDEERQDFTNVLDAGFTDAYRYLYPDTKGAFTWWTQLSKTAKQNNSGWRLDYFVVNNAIKEKIDEVKLINTGERKDHAPIMMDIR